MLKQVGEFWVYSASIPLFMEQRKFQKLNTYLPHEPIVNNRPWLIGGLLLVLAFLIFTAYAYIQYKGVF
jgi:hypothetical protein